MEKSSGTPGGMIVAILAVLLFLGVVGPCVCRPSADEELARTAREAIQSAREARQEAQEARERDDAAYLWPGRLKLLAVVAGVSMVLAAAVVLVWLSLRHRPSDMELLSHARRLRLRHLDAQASSSVCDHAPGGSQGPPAQVTGT